VFTRIHDDVKWDTTYRVIMAATRLSWKLIASIVLGVQSEGRALGVEGGKGGDLECLAQYL